MKKIRPRATHHPDLPFIKPDWKGNPLNRKNQYMNLDGASEKTFTELYKWQREKNPLKHLKKKQSSPVKVFSNKAITKCKQDGITWLGHTSFILCLNQKQIITDPVLYGVGPVKRYSKLPCSVASLTDIDYILLSHNHRDHCDKKSLQQLCLVNPNAKIITGLEIGGLLRSWKIRNSITEMGWYQQMELDMGFTCTYLPAKHWNRRGLKDLNTMLWGSFMLQSQQSTIYFGADSGLGVHFSEIANLFPAIDYALLGIGAYKPEWFMAASHTSPKDACIAFEQLQAKYLIPMHHGTFDLSDEPIHYPLKELERIIIEQQVQNVLSLVIGEKLTI